MRSADIRQRFLDHFAKHGHTIVPSASLIANDPTLLLVNAGMVPFKPYFLGEVEPPFKRAASIQKCVRTGDLEEVGKTKRHASFFEMAGNFSFGDYFKEGAIPLAWELLTSPVSDGGYGLPVDRLWVSVYLDDDEAADIWHKKVGLSPDRIQRLGKADNYWDMGVPGPCGPDSEIFYDLGPDYGNEGGPAADGNRYLEIWNLVFMQYIRGEGEGEDYPILGNLPSTNIDTGMGIERMAAVLQGVDNIYEIDTTGAILQRAAALADVTYGRDEKTDIRLRVVADHMRSTAMLIGDGVTPGNEGRGYVVRRLARRVVRSMRLLGATQPTMAELIDTAIEVMAPSYPELLTEAPRIRSYAIAEEEAFLSTLRTGTTIFDTAVSEAKAQGSTSLSGERAFTLHDTYGFPLALTLEMAAEQGLEVDEEGFRRLMADQRDMAKADRRSKGIGHADLSSYRTLLEQGGVTRFTGYDEVSRQAVVRGLLKGDDSVSSLVEGDEAEVVLDATPFYAEGGGQQPDTGRIIVRGSRSDAELEVFDVQSPLPGLIVHRVKVRSGEVGLGAEALAEIDVDRRRAIERAHTATHMVHSGFRRALGEQATQAGSMNAPGRLRFDFASPGAVPASVLGEVEDEVNEVLLADHEVRAFYTSQEEARRIGAMALFGEKYGDEVRIIEVGDYSRELCGGTHVSRSGQLGVVKLLSESSIGSGVRRVEALVGIDAFRFLAREHLLVSGLAEALKARPEELPERIDAMVSRLREAEREIGGLRGAALLQGSGTLASSARTISGVQVVSHQVPDGTRADDARALALDVRARLDVAAPAVVAVFSVSDGRAQVVVASNDAARPIGLGAGKVVKELAPYLGGGGGGKDDVAQGGGTNAAGVADAIGAL